MKGAKSQPNSRRRVRGSPCTAGVRARTWSTSATRAKMTMIMPITARKSCTPSMVPWTMASMLLS